MHIASKYKLTETYHLISTHDDPLLLLVLITEILLLYTVGVPTAAKLVLTMKYACSESKMQHMIRRHKHVHVILDSLDDCVMYTEAHVIASEIGDLDQLLVIDLCVLQEQDVAKEDTVNDSQEDTRQIHRIHILAH